MSRLVNMIPIFALAAVAASCPAAADLSNPASVKSMSLDASSSGATVHVVSAGGQRWDRLKAGPIEFHSKMKIDTRWPGYVSEVFVLPGRCHAGSCGAFPVIWHAAPASRDYSKTADMSFDASHLPVSSQTGIASIPFADAVIAKCNTHLQAGGLTKSHVFTHPLDLTFGAIAWRALDMDNAVVESGPGSANNLTHTKYDSLDVRVVCDAEIMAPVGGLSQDFGEFDVKNIKLFLTTYQSNQPGSNPGTVCPALKLTIRAEANQTGPVTMRIWSKKGEEPIAQDVQQVTASFDATRNGYFATYEKFVTVGTTSYFQYKTEVIEPGSFAPSDGWKDIRVRCTSPGGGGFTSPQPENPDQPGPQAKWSGILTVADSAGRKKSCPRQGQVSFTVTRAAPGGFDYRISCSNGAAFSGTAIGFNQGNGVFQATGAHDLSVNRTRSIQCRLQELQPAPVTVATDNEDFICNNPNVELPSDDLVSTTPPAPVKPAIPPVIVDPDRKCPAGQQSLRGKCVERPIATSCKSNEKRAGKKCVPVSIHCLPGFRQVGLKCVANSSAPDPCKRGERRVEGRCVKTVDTGVQCATGFKRVGNICVRQATVGQICPPGQRPLRGKCVNVRRLGIGAPQTSPEPRRAIDGPMVGRPSKRLVRKRRIMN